MRKVLWCWLSVVLAVSLVACGETSSGDIQVPSNVSGVIDTVTDTGKVKSQTPQVPVVGERVDVGTSHTGVKSGVSITETVLVDEADVKITAKSLSIDELFGPELKLLIENNSGQDLTVQCRNASVNGYMIETMMSSDVVNGKKINDELTFMKSNLKACGITDIADMEFSFHIFTSDTWNTYLDTQQIKIKTSIADGYEYAFDDSGHVAYDAGGIKIVVKGLSEDSSILGPSIVVYVENNTETAYTVQSRDVSINGFMVDPIFSCDIMPGKRAVDTIKFMSSNLEDNEITTISEVELSFHIFDSNSWSTSVDTDVVSVSF